MPENSEWSGKDGTFLKILSIYHDSLGPALCILYHSAVLFLASGNHFSFFRQLCYVDDIGLHVSGGGGHLGFALPVQLQLLV